MNRREPQPYRLLLICVILSFLLLTSLHVKYFTNYLESIALKRMLRAQQRPPDNANENNIIEFKSAVRRIGARKKPPASTAAFFLNSTTKTTPPLNLEPAHYQRCTTVRFRGDHHNYTVDEAMQVMMVRNQRQSQQGDDMTGKQQPSLRMGIEFVETPDRFFPVRVSSETHSSAYHLFHFVELLVVAYAELHRMMARTAASGGTKIEVPWIYGPHMTSTELCGGPVRINCLIADLALRASGRSVFQNQTTGILGLDALEDHVYRTPLERKEKAVPRRVQLVQELYSSSTSTTTSNPAAAAREDDYYYQKVQSFADRADAVLLVERFGCDAQGINKPWAGYIDDFPADEWHADVLKGLGALPLSAAEESKPTKAAIVIGYVDRQNSSRRLRDDHHEWLVGYLSSLAGSDERMIDFRHLHMEDYEAAEQIKIASQCDVLIGVHGNGLSHALWMAPRRYVVELYWKYPFQFDYATAAQLMKHQYLGIQNGNVLDGDTVARRDVALRHSTDKKAVTRPDEDHAAASFETEGKPAIQKFIEQAIRELT